MKIETEPVHGSVHLEPNSTQNNGRLDCLLRFGAIIYILVGSRQMLGLQKAQSTSYLWTLGPKVGIIDILAGCVRGPSS